MYFKSLLNIPLGYCRVNQRYIMDIKDFLLIEILLCVLLIILTKGIFEVKISKLQFAINQTERAAKYLNFTKEDFAHRNAFFNKRFNFAPGKSVPKKSSLSSDLEKSVQRSGMSSMGFQAIKTTTLSNMSSMFFNSNLKNAADCKNLNSCLNSSASDSCGSNANSCTDGPFKQRIEGETLKGVTHCPSECYSKQELTRPKTTDTVTELTAKSQSSCSEKEKINSTGTFTVKSSMVMSTDRQNPSMSKIPKSATQGLNYEASANHQHGMATTPRSNAPNITKSFSQALTPPSNSSRLTPIKPLRSAMRTSGPDKAFKSKSQDLRASHLKR